MDYDIIIIGAGPAGYVAAIRAGQVGLKTALIEKDNLGGMCLNWGCIPVKSLIESAKVFNKVKNSNSFGVKGVDVEKVFFDWSAAKKRASQITNKLNGGINYLLVKNGVDIIHGKAKITSLNSVVLENRKITASNIIIATGSYPQQIGFEHNKSFVNVDKLFEIEELPQKIAIVGYGAAAVELAQLFVMLGREVSLISPKEDIIPGLDKVTAKYIIDVVTKSGVNILKNENILSFDNNIVKTQNNEINAELIVNCSIRNAVIPDSDIELKLTDDGYIYTDVDFMTSQKGIYAVGDVNGYSYLAHIASSQGIYVVNNIKGVQSKFNFAVYPLNIYTFPEVAQIGNTSEQLQAEGIDFKTNEYPLSANAKALIEGQPNGMIRILSDKKFGQVLGVQIVAENATDMIMEAAAFMQMEGTVYDVAQTIHAHPTVSEIFMEAGFDAIDKAIHK